jgi:peptidoglycan LD-endopeptidase CwlK
MSKFSQTSKDRLISCHSDLQILCNKLIERYDFAVICGHRGEEEQNKAFREGNSKLQWPNSKHNTEPSLAIDIVSYEDGRLDWSKTQSAYFAGRVMGTADELFAQGIMKHRIRPGVDWNNDNNIDDTKFWDSAHFEIIPN